MMDKLAKAKMINTQNITDSLCFSVDQSRIVDKSSSLAEELVSNHYKLSENQWLQRRYDIKTRAHLTPEEIVTGHFAQVIRYKGRKENTSLESMSYDFYKICVQDHTILSAIRANDDLSLFPFLLYIITHELIHIVRFSQFTQNFEASQQETLIEEKRVHAKTFDILSDTQISGLTPILNYYRKWQSVNGIGTE